MRLLLISDLHLRGKVNDMQLYALYEIINQLKPDVVFHAGDTGSENVDVLEYMDSEYFFKDVLKEVPFYTVYGNHDSVAIRDIKNIDGSHIWLKDGMNNIMGLKVYAFNGIFGFSKHNWYHRSLDEAVKLAFKHYNANPDLMITHEVPYGEWTKVHSIHKYLNVLNFTMDFIKPNLYLFGHLHVPEPHNATIFNDTYVLRVDTSPRHGSFAIVEYDGKVKSIDIYLFNDFIGKGDIYKEV